MADDDEIVEVDDEDSDAGDGDEGEDFSAVGEALLIAAKNLTSKDGLAALDKWRESWEKIQRDKLKLQERSLPTGAQALWAGFALRVITLGGGIGAVLLLNHWGKLAGEATVGMIGTFLGLFMAGWNPGKDAK